VTGFIMSRLDSFIRRLEAQRACLDLAAALIRDRAGPVLEFGLGNGRTFDHLREILPDREIFVFERRLAAHPDCIPPVGWLILGDVRKTLPAAQSRFAGRPVLVHFDIGNGVVAATRALTCTLAQLVAPLVQVGAVIVSEPPLAVSRWHSLGLPDGVAPGRYHLYCAA
jgi:S-adenosyl-L-methionine methyltransferase